MEEALWELAKAMEGIAPDLWRIAMKQVAVTAQLNLMMFIICAIALVASVAFICKESDSVFIFGGSIAIAFLSVFFGVGCILFALPRLLNPEFYAIKLLLDYVK